MQLKRIVGKVLGVAAALGVACAPSGDQDDAAHLGTTRQALGETVTPDKASYVVGESVRIAFAGFPQNSHDWITIAPAGAANTDFRGWRYTAGLASGSVTIPAPGPPGQYVVRAFLDDGFTLLAESAEITVATSGATTTTTDKASYLPADSVVVSFGNLAGHVYDWVAISPAGSPATSFGSWSYTFGAASGSRTFPAPPPGQYVARSYLNGGFTIQAESAPFTVASGPTVTSDKAAYYNDEKAVFTYSGMSGSPKDWLGIAPVGSDPNGYVRWSYISGESGSIAFSLVGLTGTYVVRAYFNDSFVVEAESAPFTVETRPVVPTDAGAGGPATVSRDKASYLDNELVVVTFAGMSGAQRDWLSIAPAASGAEDWVRWVYVYGQTSGAQSFAVAGLNGSYVARAYFNDSFVVEAETEPFTVTPAP